MRTLLTAGLLAVAAITGVQAQPAAPSYPVKPISVIVPYSAGGTTDLSARILSEATTKMLGQPMVVVNRAGAAGVIGSQMVRNAAPDGYTLLLARAGAQAITPAIDSKVPYKWDDYTFLSLLEFNPVACVARADAPYRNLQELIAYLREHPGKLNYPDSGPGTIPQMATQVLFSIGKLGRDVAVSVPYKSDGDSSVALLGNQVQFMCSNATAFIPLIKSGQLRGLAVAMPERIPDLPEVPTAREQGYPDLEKVVGWSALYGPPGMSPELVDRWQRIMSDVAKDKHWLQANARSGSVPAVRSASETQRFVREQFDFYNKLIGELGIRR